jgi:hypothetical protein
MLLEAIAKIGSILKLKDGTFKVIDVRHRLYDARRLAKRKPGLKVTVIGGSAYVLEPVAHQLPLPLR